MSQPVQQMLTVILAEIGNSTFYAADQVTGQVSRSRQLSPVRLSQKFLKRQTHDLRPFSPHLAGGLIELVGKYVSDPNGQLSLHKQPPCNAL